MKWLRLAAKGHRNAVRVLDAIVGVVLITLAMGLILEVRALRWASSADYDLWMVQLPAGYDLDIQRSHGGERWAIFWQDFDGSATRIASGA